MDNKNYLKDKQVKKNLEQYKKKKNINKYKCYK